MGGVTVTSFKSNVNRNGNYRLDVQRVLNEHMVWFELCKFTQLYTNIVMFINGFNGASSFRHRSVHFLLLTIVPVILCTRDVELSPMCTQKVRCLAVFYARK